ncbi:MAG: DUF3987 domain-containing protein [Longimonas sp.]|uniref:DUF3987 domain-containing protein n=1 Tax=Longimonas sp. TaxID=2039626 RepID=UPI003361E6B3
MDTSFPSSRGDSAGGDGMSNDRSSPSIGPTRHELADQVAALSAELSSVKRERNKHEEHAAELADRVQALRFRLKRVGGNPDALNGALPESLIDDSVDSEKKLGPLRDEHPLDGCAAFPEDAFADLPAVLDESCAFWDRPHKRDVYLTSALGVLSGCMPKVEGYWGADVPTRVRTNLYMAYVAGAAGGKSAGGFAKQLTRKVAEDIRKSADRAIAQWEDDKKQAAKEGEPFDDPEPPHRSLYVPANVSASYLLETLANQGGRGVMFSSEIDTMNDAMGQEWGHIDSFLRKAYHHESDAQGRRSDGTIHVPDPSVSLVLGGTLQQFADLIKSPENGLYSRFCLYYFNASDPWEDQKPSREGIKRLDRLSALSERVLDLYQQLKGRPKALRFEIEDAHWSAIRSKLEPLHRSVQEQGFSHLLSIVRRAGLWAYRIAMVLSVLRAHDERAGIRTIDTLTPCTRDVETALQLAHTYANHSLRFARARLNADSAQSPRDKRITAMLTTMDEQFASGEAYAAAQDAGFDVTKRTLRKDLKEAEKRGLIESIARGQWRKASHS